jgi:hypothetical protein
VAYAATGLLVATFAGATLPPAAQAAARLVTAAILGYSLLRPALGSRPAWRPARRHRGALVVGLLQGIAPCPPFVAAVGLGLSASGPAAGLLLFLALFASTTLMTLPLALLEPLRRRAWLAQLTRAVGAAVLLYLLATAVLLLVSP